MTEEEECQPSRPADYGAPDKILLSYSTLDDLGHKRYCTMNSPQRDAIGNFTTIRLCTVSSQVYQRFQISPIAQKVTDNLETNSTGSVTQIFADPKNNIYSIKAHSLTSEEYFVDG